MEVWVHIRDHFATIGSSFLGCAIVGLLVGILLFFRSPANSTVRAVILRALFYSIPIGLAVNVGMGTFMGLSNPLEYALFALSGAFISTLFATFALTAGLPVLRHWIGISKNDCSINAMGQMRLKL